MKLKITLLYLLLCSMAFSQTKMIHAGHLLDVKTGKVLAKQSILIENNIIKSVQTGFQTPPSGATLVDLKDKYVLPGLIDMHVHIETEYSKNSNLRRFIANVEDNALSAFNHGRITLNAGFTTVRDLGGSGGNIALRNAINSGMLEGPRIYTSRKSLAITGGHADGSNGMRLDFQIHSTVKDGVCNNADDCAEAVRWQVKQGADVIKITATGGVLSVAKDGDKAAFSLEEIEAIVQTAKDRGVDVAAHAHGKQGMMRAIRGGVKTIEHGTYMDDEVIELMKKHDTWLVPTITAGKSVADSALIPGFFPKVVKVKALVIGAQIQETFANAYKKGVNIAFGTDAGVFAHGRNAVEFQYMVEVGMPEMEAIQSATIVNAKLLKNDQIGHIASGKFADIIAVDENPIKDITTLQNVTFVMKDGVVYKGKKE